MRNLSVLRELGVPHERLFAMLTWDHNFVCGKERFEESLKKVVEMGFDPSTTKFVQALRVLNQMNERKVEERVQVYKRLGFAVIDVWEMFKKYHMVLALSEKKIVQKFETLKKCGLVENEVRSVLNKFPPCIAYSEQKINNSTETFLGLGFSRDEFALLAKRSPSSIRLSAETVKKKTEFLVKKMNWPLKALLSKPQVLNFSMEKRIVPRCNVIKALMSKGLLGSEIPPISSVLVCTDDAFLNRYVNKFNNMELVTELMEKTNKACDLINKFQFL